MSVLYIRNNQDGIFNLPKKEKTNQNLIPAWTDSQNALKVRFTGTLLRNYILKLCDLLVVLELLSESFMPITIKSFFSIFP